MPTTPARVIRLVPLAEGSVTGPVRSYAGQPSLQPMGLPILADALSLSREWFVSLGAPGLFLVAFLEFFLFPVPPDFVLIPLALANPEFAFGYAAVATVGSVSAGLLGYGVGRAGGYPALHSRFGGAWVDRAEGYVDRYGVVTLAVGAFVPVPEGYELLSVAWGALGLGPRSYLLASLVGRGGKYFLEAGLVLALGETIQSLSEMELYAVVGAVAVVAVTGYVLGTRLGLFPD